MSLHFSSYHTAVIYQLFRKNIFLHSNCLLHLHHVPNNVLEERGGEVVYRERKIRERRKEREKGEREDRKREERKEKGSSMIDIRDVYI